jgi:hypothetical protein
MLYKLCRLGSKKTDINPIPFLNYGDIQKLEKDLEVLFADHLLTVLFEETALMPIFQERQFRSEADLYALNRSGDLIIFEFKRSMAGAEAMHQILWYAQQAGQWTFNMLEEKFRCYSEGMSNNGKALADAHQEAFQLERPLLPTQFNTKQQLIVIGSAANDSLVDAVDYWKIQGLSVDFIPYRVYKIGGECYFEFFALPYDQHPNPAALKGVLFDTNRSYDEDAIWEMMENNRVAAYGDNQDVVEYLQPKDLVFFSHKWVGLIAAAEVIGPVKSDGENEKYRDIRFLTPIPLRDEGLKCFMSFSQVSQVTGKSFFWARTIKVPYLNRDEAMNLLAELNKTLRDGS